MQGGCRGVVRLSLSCGMNEDQAQALGWNGESSSGFFERGAGVWAFLGSDPTAEGLFLSRSITVTQWSCPVLTSWKKVFCSTGEHLAQLCVPGEGTSPAHGGGAAVLLPVK